MYLLDLTLPTPAENVALDEALLEAAEAGDCPSVLRLWEPRETFVVVGRSSRVAEEVAADVCQAERIPILRRASGGAAIVTGPGCLMYSVVQAYDGREHLRMLDQLHQQVLGTVRAAVETLLSGVEHLGTCDLALAGRKFSGNSVRCKRDHFLYHGTLLYGFDLVQIQRLLKSPPRQPQYRAGRSHAEFVMNLPLTAEQLRSELANAFGARRILKVWPEARTTELANTRYTSDSWNFSR